MKQLIGVIFTILFATVATFSLVEIKTEANKVRDLSKTIEKKIQINQVTLKRNSYIYDKNGELVSEVYGPENRKYVQFKDIPKQVVNTFVAAEDQRFYKHKGIDLKGITRAIVVNAKESDVKQGGSTITQQLVRNVFLTHDRTYKRKITELFMSYKLEQKYTKDEIFELYANAIYFQNGIYGIETASQYYFGRPINDLSVAETAFLAAIPNNPTFFDPIKHYDNTIHRQHWILSKMLELNYITKAQYDEAMNQKIALNVQEPKTNYPDYVTYVHNEFEQLVAQAEGYQKRIDEAPIEQKDKIRQELKERARYLMFEKGLKIETALDPNVQQRASDSINRMLYGKVQGSVVVIDHKTHEIIAMSGGKDHKLFEFNRAFQAYRQPGSAIKPLLVYGPYINEKKVSPYSLVNANNFDKGNYHPRNYSKREYGYVTLDTALKLSHNTPAVRMLDQLGVDKAFTYLDKFQFSKVGAKDHNLSAALGGLTYGVTPLELTNAYTVFGTNGQWEPSHAIRRVLDEQGNVLYEWKQEPVVIWSKGTNDKMRSMLHSVVASGTAANLGVQSEYIGGKTGTTNNYKDVWFVGLTEHYTSGVWIGADRKMSVSGYENTKLSIWRNVMAPLAGK